MESNFIKERHVIRREIINKNLSGQGGSKLGQVPLENPSQQVLAFEEVVNEGLKQDLAVVSKQASDVCQTIAEYLKIKSALKIFKNNPHDVRVQTNLGCNFYAQCDIEDGSEIYLSLGKDYFLRLKLNEALQMIDFLESKWTQHLDQLQEKASRIKSYIKVSLEALGIMYEIDRDKLTEE